MTIFSPEQLHDIVATTLPQLPNGHTKAVVGAIDQHGAKVVAGFTLGADARWQFEGAFAHDWTGANSAGANVLLSW